MSYLLNAAYLVLLLALSPWLLYKCLATGKYRRGLWSKLTGRVCRTALRAPHSALTPVAWFHGVSVGEIHLLRQVVARFQQRHPDWLCVISTTTDTGLDEARKRFPGLPVIYWQLDFSWAVNRALREVKPSLVILAEGELWPNFLAAAKRRGVPVAVVNGRMSPRSFWRYRRFGGLMRRSLMSADLLAVQTEDYAACFRELGAPPESVHVTGSVKYDGVESDRHNSKTEELRTLFQVEPGDLVWIAGSTQAPEEQIVLDIFRRVRGEHPNLRLFLVPRQKERFEEVAKLLEREGETFVRRSILRTRNASRIVLMDTIGELSALWGLADVAFVGGSLDGRRGGQNMIEPAAYGAAVVFGPHVWNFRDTVDRLLQVRAALQINDPEELEKIVRRLLDDGEERRQMGEAAKRFVLQQQGATDRTMALLEQVIASWCERETASKSQVRASAGLSSRTTLDRLTPLL